MFVYCWNIFSGRWWNGLWHQTVERIGDFTTQGPKLDYYAVYGSQYIYKYFILSFCTELILNQCLMKPLTNQTQKHDVTWGKVEKNKTFFFPLHTKNRHSNRWNKGQWPSVQWLSFTQYVPLIPTYTTWKSCAVMLNWIKFIHLGVSQWHFLFFHLVSRQFFWHQREDLVSPWHWTGQVYQVRIPSVSCLFWL